MVPVALLVEDVRASASVGTRDRGRNVDLLREEERQVAGERRLHAVGPLVQEDAVAAADDRAGVVQREREADSRGQADGARIQQSAAPAGFLRCHVRNRNQRQQMRRALD